MTVGKRIAQKRKELGLSQEGLGEQLGVSRQAIYKWESDATLPEIEKLIALSRIFAAPVGWLLGVEDAGTQEAAPDSTAPEQTGELTRTQLDMVEEIVRRYQQAAKPKRRRWLWVLAVIVLIVVFARLFAMLNQLQEDYNRMQSSVDYIDRNVDNQISSITSRVESILNNLNSFTVEQSGEIVSADLANNTVTFALRAVPKTYTEGMTAVFRAQYGEGAADVAEVPAELGEGRVYTAELTCPLTNDISLSVIFTTGDKSETQNIRSYDSLYRCSFPMQYISTMPLDFDLEGDVFPSGDTWVHGGTFGMEYDLQASQLAQARLGLFRGRELVYWLTPLAEKPSTFHGSWEGHLFYLNEEAYTLDRDGTYCLALVVTDEFGREIVLADTPICYRPGETGSDGIQEPGDWTYADSDVSSTDPADWVY